MGAARKAAWACGLATVLALVAADVVRAAATVSASVESEEVAVGQPFLLSITIEGAQNVPAPSVATDGFRSQYLGPATQVSFVNGRMSASVTHRFRLVAEREGSLTLGPYQVDVGGSRQQTAPISVRVQGAGVRGGRDRAGRDLRLTMQPARSEIYVGERVEVVVTLYVGDVQVRSSGFPVIQADGVTVEKFSEPERSTELLDGRAYTAVRLRTTLTPVRAGPVELRTTVALTAVSRRPGMDLFFGPLYDGDERQIDLAAEPVQLTVLPLPVEGRPTDFNGAVGDFSFELLAKPLDLDAGDPITLRMEIAGRGNLAAVTAPAWPVDEAFRHYDAQPVKGEDGSERRVFEQVVIPKGADVREIPALRFSFFDPQRHTYRSIVRGPVVITVHAGAGSQGQVVSGQPAPAPTVQAEAPLGRDLVYIKDAPGAFVRRGERWYQRGWLVVALALPPLVFLASLVLTRRRERLAADPRQRLLRTAGRTARRALAELRSRAGEGQPFYDLLSNVVGTYLATRLDLPPGRIEPDKVLARLHVDGRGEPLRQRISEFFALVEHARYAPGANAGERDTALGLALAIVDGLERERGVARRFGALRSAIALAWALAALAHAESAGPQADFFRGNQAYAAGRYEEAAQAYESALRGGSESGALHFNLGNAYMKRGEVGRAIASYERAARLLPRDPDVAANLSFARDQAQVEEPPAPLWQRLLAAPAFRATGGELAAACLVAWTALWGLLAIRTWLARPLPGLGQAAAAAAVVSIALGASLALRLASLDSADRAVVIAAAATPVRFEPAATGTEHFIVTPGVALEVLEARDDWRQVRRSDGRRGWLPAGALEMLD